MSRLHQALQQIALGSDQSRQVLSTSAETELKQHLEVNGTLQNGEYSSIYFSGAVQEEIVRFVQRVFLFSNSTAPRLVLFSNVDDNTSSSQVCVRSLDALATQVPGSVCLVDANLRAPIVHELLETGNLRGFSDAMISPDPIQDFAVRVGNGNLWFIRSGSQKAHNAALFARARLYSRMQELKQRFDYVLVNAPPVSTGGDAVLLGQMADGVVLIIEAASTRREAARIAKAHFETANAKLLGAILTKNMQPIPNRLPRKV